MAKKYISIDTTTNRNTGFLLGLIAALTMLFVALEWHSGGAQDEAAELDSDDMVQDISFTPQQRDDMIPAVKPQAAARSIAQKIKKVEVQTETEVAPKLDQTNGEAEQGDGGAKEADDDSNDETAALPQQPTDLDNNPMALRVVEKLPEFPGGMVEFMKWITKNLHYPAEAQRKRIQGQVKVGFIVGKDGTVSELKVVKHADPLLENEALRVLRTMPKWKPGEDKGKPCLTYFCIPVNFSL